MALTTTKQRQAIGERLKSERERLGYTEQQIAQLLGVTLTTYQEHESGQADPGVFALPRLDACGFDILFITLGTRNNPLQEESELLRRFRDLSLRGRASIFTTLDALERLAPNLKQTLKDKWRDTMKGD